MANLTDISLVRQFFQDYLVPAAAALRDRGVVLLPVPVRSAAEHDASSWYVDVSQREPEFISLVDENLESRLGRLWNLQSLPEIEGLAHPLVELVEHLGNTKTGPSDLSPFMYVMY